VRQTWPVRSKTFRAEYIRYLRRQFERLANDSESLLIVFALAFKKSAVNAAIDDFELRAIASSIERRVYIRIAGDGDHIFIDLGDPQWHAVRITADGWTVVQSPPVRFRRTKGMQALPFPERGTPISALRPFMPNLDDGGFILTVAYLLAALRPRGPYLTDVAYGEQGSAKTTRLRFMRALFDPNEVASSRLPASGRDLFIAAANSHAQMYENVSRLSAAMSDDLCRLARGGGNPARCSQTATKRYLPGRGLLRWKGSAISLRAPICSTAASFMRSHR
jgi:hypothetical protein